MNTFSLRTLIDDIMLIVRNNNISESEDFSRSQIASWIIAYKSFLIKKKQDDSEMSDDDSEDDSLMKTIGPLELIQVESLDNTKLYTKRTKEKIPQLAGDSANNIISIQDQEGCPIQKMNEQRRHFHYFRRYTFGELTSRYENGYVYVDGLVDLNRLKYIWIQGVFADNTDQDEDSIKIPLWMVPQIKDLIFKNELKFMVAMPSDDSNNSTIDGIKPQEGTSRGLINEK